MKDETRTNPQADLSQPANLQQRMLDAQTRLLYANFPTSLAVNAGVAAVTASLAWFHFPALPVLGWLCAALLVVAIRGLVLKSYATAPTRTALRAFALGAFGSGAVWGAASLMFFGSADVQFKMTLQMIIAGMAAGGLPVLASVTYVYAGFAALTVLPMGLVLLLQEDLQWASVAALNVIFLAAMLSLARRYSRNLNDGLRLRFENEALLGDVIREKTVVHRANEQLERQIERRLQVESDLVSAKEIAETANRAKSEFLSSMSQELRTPLNAVLGFAQLLKANVAKEPLTASQLEAVGHIHQAGYHLLGLINKVLDLARIESGKLPLFITETSVATIVKESTDLLLVTADARKVALSVQCDSDASVMADPMRLKQALLNLFSNGVKYNREGGVLTIRCGDGDDGMLRIDVSDQGAGISADRIAHLFEPFNRLGAERSSVEGSGVGLAVTRNLIHAMNGRFGCESELGVGSTFWIELPRAASTRTAWQHLPKQV